MSKFFGVVLICGGLVLLPVPATMLFGISYGTALGASVLAFVAALALQLGAGLVAS